MTQEQILRRMETGRQTPRHLCRLYLFACASRLPESFLCSLRQAICERLSVDEERFYRLFSETCSQWQLRADRLQFEAESLPGILRFEKRYRSRPAPGLSVGKAARLQISLCLLTLQKFSVQTGKNHLKSRDLQRFSSLLCPGGELAAFESIFFRPFCRVMDGKWKAGGEDFLLTVLMHAQLLADYLQADSEQEGADPSARKQILCEFIRASRQMNRAEIQQFLCGMPLERRPESVQSSPASLKKRQ